MNIPDPLRKELVRELRHVSKKIVEEEMPQRKVFFYSAAYGIARRILNLSYDPQINLVECILEITFNTINARVQSIIQGDVTIPLVDGFFSLLATHVMELASRIEKNEDVYKTLESITALAHLTTGNGYYLYTKGVIKI